MIAICVCGLPPHNTMIASCVFVCGLLPQFLCALSIAVGTRNAQNKEREVLEERAEAEEACDTSKRYADAVPLSQRRPVCGRRSIIATASCVVRE